MNGVPGSKMSNNLEAIQDTFEESVRVGVRPFTMAPGMAFPYFCQSADWGRGFKAVQRHGGIQEAFEESLRRGVKPSLPARLLSFSFLPGCVPDIRGAASVAWQCWFICSQDSRLRKAFRTQGEVTDLPLWLFMGISILLPGHQIEIALLPAGGGDCGEGCQITLALQ